MTESEKWNFGICPYCRNSEWIYNGGRVILAQEGAISFFKYTCLNCDSKIELTQLYRDKLTLQEYRKKYEREIRLSKLNKINDSNLFG